MKKSDDYINSIHRIGRLGAIGAMSFMLGIPAIISTVYGIWPRLGDILKVSSGLLVLFVPIAVSEVISYMPILGSASYITYITGNVLNLKIPCAINAMRISGTTQGTEEGDVISTLAIAASSITTMLIIALGVFLLVPLSPIFSNPYLKTATSYMLPALFGGMFFPMLLDKSAGDYNVKGKLLPILIPVICIFLVDKYIKPLSGFEGIAMLVVIPFTILTARILYNKNIITMSPKDISKFKSNF